MSVVGNPSRAGKQQTGCSVGTLLVALAGRGLLLSLAVRVPGFNPGVNPAWTVVIDSARVVGHGAAEAWCSACLVEFSASVSTCSVHRMPCSAGPVLLEVRLVTDGDAVGNQLHATDGSALWRCAHMWDDWRDHVAGNALVSTIQGRDWSCDSGRQLVTVPALSWMSATWMRVPQ